jgi:uncharacterized protein
MGTTVGVMRVVDLWRYPVKSLQGERLAASDVVETGLVGDRRWALVDTSTGHVLTARRVPELLMASARHLAPDGVAITLPDGTESNDDDVLSDWLGRPVELRRADQHESPTYEAPVDDLDPEAQWAHWEGPTGVFHDSKRTQVSICSLASMGDWDRRRFRFNVIVDGEDEDDLVGSEVRIGDVGLVVKKRIDRCVMVTRPQPDGIERDTSVLKTINRERDRCLGIGAVVRTHGRIAIGDEVVRWP